MVENFLFRLDFDLAYLALLTRYRVKRLSRWEGNLNPEQIAILKELGLRVTAIRRRLRFGRKTDEVVFSPKTYYTEFYKRHFHMRRVTEAPAEVRLKGFLFGYPACCVNRFIEKPYAKNDLARQDQEILFHWACQGCKVTPLLLRDYRDIHRECVGLFGGADALASRAVAEGAGASTLRLAFQRGAVPVALGLSALLLTPQLGGSYQPKHRSLKSPVTTDPHWLPVEDDTDGDYLSYAEEILRGTDAQDSDTDEDGILDGVEEAYLIHGLIAALPDSVQADQPYKLEFRQRGLENCEICGAEINMGYVNIVNPLRGLGIDLPFMCLHYLEHGGLSYLGTLHSGRLDMALIKRILLATDESHLVCDYYRYDFDGDMDGLGDREEAMLGTSTDTCDTDGDSVKDGPQYLEPSLELLSQLPREVREEEPFLIEHRAFGLEVCDSCGAIFNMGYVEIVNPMEGMILEAPFVALHYLAHGSSGYNGSEHIGRVLPIALRTVLTGDGTAHWLEVEGDADGDGLKDEEEPHFSLDPADSDTDDDGLPDGPELAMAMAEVINQLPEGPRPDSTYVNHWLAKGRVYCLICGESVNMGWMEIVNPVAGTSMYVDYINHHYMEHGSFYADYEELYRVDPRDLDAVLEMSSRASDQPVQHTSAPLLIYPNPFRRLTNILSNVGLTGEADIAIYDSAGRMVKDLSPLLGRGKRLVWDGKDSEGRRVAPGTYFCKIRTGDISYGRKVVLLE